MFVFILMIMPMVQIWPVFMSVLLRFVFMPMCMVHCAPKLIMIVIMMEPIMMVEVLVQYKIMSVQMDIGFFDLMSNHGPGRYGFHQIKRANPCDRIHPPKDAITN